MALDSSNDTLYFYINLDSKLLSSLSNEFKLSFSELRIHTFPDGEYFAQPTVSVRSKRIFILHSLSYPVHENIMKLLLTIDAIKRSSAREINLVLGYLPYTRQDRKTEGRSPISAKLISNLLECAGANRIITLDLHSDQIEGFFNIPIDHLYTVPIFAEYLIENHMHEFSNFVIVAPDFGATKKARMLSSFLSIPFVIMEKRRGSEGIIQEQNVYGDICSKKCLIFDDIIGTGETILNSIHTLKKMGAEGIYICATHGLFSSNALEKFEKAWNEGLFEYILVTDSIPRSKEYSFLKIVSIGKLLFEIFQIYSDSSGSISNLYEKWKEKLMKRAENKKPSK